jgi:hypothetical protein
MHPASIASLRVASSSFAVMKMTGHFDPDAASIDVRYWQILLQKGFWGGDRNFSGPLMRFARGDMRDHIVSHQNDLGASYRRYGVLQWPRRPKINFCEIFDVVRFSTFATISARSGPCSKCTKNCRPAIAQVGSFGGPNRLANLLPAHRHRTARLELLPYHSLRVSEPMAFEQFHRSLSFEFHESAASARAAVPNPGPCGGTHQDRSAFRMRGDTGGGVDSVSP